MGLDMYLSKKTYVQNWNHTPTRERNKIIVLKGGIPNKEINTDKISYITEEICNWRKANQIHNWFVCNVQSNIDDCLSHYVSLDNLKDLIDTCKKVKIILKGSKRTVEKKIETGWANGEKTYTIVKVYPEGIVDKINQLLPPTQGFFFGSEEIDEWYLEDIEYTIKTLGPYLNIPGDYYYNSSW